MKHIIKPALSLFLIAAIVTLALAIVYRITLEPIENQQRRIMERMLREIMPQAESFREIDVILSENMVRVFEGISGSRIGYVVEMTTAGYSGRINMMVGILSSERKVAGIRILSHTETPGLGANITRESFYLSFDNKNLAPLESVRSYPGENEIQALTSATISTRAVLNAVNEAINWYVQGGYE